MSFKRKKIFLICTGLGQVRRGFETYIADLGNLLTNEISINANVSVFSSGVYRFKKFKSRKVWCISRNSKVLQLFIKDIHQLFEIEQFSFFISFCFHLIFSKPNVIYLGEYNIYCYLFKLRKLLRLKYSLVLFTGGQAFPGLFNNELDFVHHVTDVYYTTRPQELVDRSREFLVPHFLNCNTIIDDALYNSLTNLVGRRKIVLAVGSIDKKVKRLDVLVESLVKIKKDVFPIFLGEFTPESVDIQNRLSEVFGDGNFLVEKVSREVLPTYYSAAAVIASFSLRESFGLVNLEALLQGTPVICHDYKEARFVIGDVVELTDLTIDTDLISKLITPFSSDVKYPLFRKYVVDNYGLDVLKYRYEVMFNSFIAN